MTRKKPQRKTLDLKRIRRLAKQGSTGRRGPDATEIVSELREERITIKPPQKSA